MSRYCLVIFDLDRTLADSLPWFLANVNGVADRFGFRPIAASDIPALRSAGPLDILKHLDVPAWKLPLIARHMRRLKALHLDDIPLFPGVDHLLQALAATGVTTAMVSSDAEANVRRALGPGNAALIEHYACGASLLGKAAKFKGVLRRAGVAPARALAIGDEIRDLEAARKTGIAFGAVAWGYASAEALKARAPDAMFASLNDIVRHLA